ncbi:MAG: type IV secretion system DNA-binding domain-containing protein, partial [Bradyrhizobium sp.]|nr:type IV secretion system DNA-binding domain-containing protein [Bradyrhizobium sp.]
MDRLANYEYRPATPAAFALVGMALLSCLIGLALSFALIPPTAWRQDTAVAVSVTEMVSNINRHGPLAALSADDLLRETLPRLIGITLAALMSGIIAFRVRRRATPIVDGREHYEGLKLLKGPAAIASANELLGKGPKGGDRTIQWLPGVFIPRVMEVQNLLILGAIASGKTRIILYLLEEMIGRLLRNPSADYGLFVHDTTGEILDGFPMEDDQFAFINPDRPGTFAWAMGRDLRDDGDCESA